jgi:hypothetical protein
VDANYRIPIETAHTILATFGIAKPTRAYERWVKPDGFDVRDFSDVLFESPFVFIVDWRAWLNDELETISNALARLGQPLRRELDEEGNYGFAVGADGRRAAVKYVPNEKDEFDSVVRAVQAVVSPSIEFRASPGNRGSDTWIYGVLPNDEWMELQNVAGPVIAHFFVPLN